MISTKLVNWMENPKIARSAVLLLGVSGIFLFPIWCENSLITTPKMKKIQPTKQHAIQKGKGRYCVIIKIYL